ncbi:MAG: SprT-like domain-containing protein [Clostridiales Family XIII bacterium]|jgi:TPR repeat protein|nr:SprT-like domain-containing protein [Clostridiales Family XIII bacterium]
METKTAIEYSKMGLKKLQNDMKADDVWAEFILARKYELGIGLKQDSAKALWHYRHVANVYASKHLKESNILREVYYQAIVCTFLATKSIKRENLWFGILLSEDIVLENLDAAEQWWGSSETYYKIERDVEIDKIYLWWGSLETYYEIKAAIWSIRLLFQGNDLYRFINSLTTYRYRTQENVAVIFAFTRAVLFGCRGIEINKEIARVLSGDFNFSKSWYKDKRRYYRDLSKLLAVAYREGLGTKQDDSISLFFLRRAAYLRDMKAQRQLSELYRDGIGVDANPDIADYWTYRADNGGLPLHAELTSEVLNNMLAEEIVKAKNCGISLLKINPVIEVGKKNENMRGALGRCSINFQKKEAVIRLNSYFVKGDEEEVREVIAHEVLHATVDTQADPPHGEVWLGYMDRMMRHYGYPFPKATSDFTTASFEEGLETIEQSIPGDLSFLS